LILHVYKTTTFCAAMSRHITTCLIVFEKKLLILHVITYGVHGLCSLTNETKRFKSWSFYEGARCG